MTIVTEPAIPAKCFIIYIDCSLHSAADVNNKTLAEVPT